MSGAAKPQWRLLGRSECHLCEQMLAELTAGFPAVAAATEYCDVDSREDWRRRYGARVPMLLDAWDEVVCEVHFDAAALHELLAELARRSVSAS